MINEHERVVLNEDVLDHGLRAGDVGTVVHVHAGHAAFEVEFLALNGDTETIVTMNASQIRPVRKHEITHARELAVA